MCPQGQRFRVLRAQLTDQPGPDRPGRAQFRDLHEEVHPDGPEEAQPRGEPVDVQPGRGAGPQIFQTVGQRVRQLQVGGRTGLLDVVAGNGDRVEFRHPGRGEGEDVRDDPHGRRRRVDIGVADHELLEDVVLDGAGQFLRRHPLFLGGDDVQRQHRQHGAVHRHRHADGVQRDVVEQLPHVVDGIDGHPGHPDVPGHPGMVGVVAAVGGQVERDRQALLPGGEIAPVERVRFLRGGEARVLPDRPRLGGVHRRIRAAQEWRQPRVGVQRVQPVQVGRAVDRLHRNAFRRQPGSPTGPGLLVDLGVRRHAVARCCSARSTPVSGSSAKLPAHSSVRPGLVGRSVARFGPGRNCLVRRRNSTTSSPAAT